MSNILENKKISINHQQEGYERLDTYNGEKVKTLSSHYSSIITELGEDIEREGSIDSVFQLN